jgi:N-acetyl-alpha-D-muramate 1-phosphate uridylyltransferase
VSVARRAMLLAAGRGERLRPHTDTLPKPLVAVGGRPLIEWHLERLAQSGVREVAINTSWLGAMLRASLGDGTRFGLTLGWFDEGAQPLEAAGGIINALGFLGAEPFSVVNADIATAYPLPPPAPAPGRLAHLVLVPNPPEHARGDFGIECGELRLDAPQRLTFAGIASYRAEFFAALAPGRRALKPLLDRALAAGLVSAEVYEGRWNDVGTPERLAAANAALR